MLQIRPYGSSRFRDSICPCPIVTQTGVDIWVPLVRTPSLTHPKVESWDGDGPRQSLVQFGLLRPGP
eukprot:jgi/Botrbrau1/13961/Bobra.250_1s0015.1